MDSYLNYEPLADTDNGSCDYCGCIGYTTDMPEYGENR